MSCSTLSVSSEWELQADSVEGATGERGKELETDCYLELVSLKTH